VIQTLSYLIRWSVTKEKRTGSHSCSARNCICSLKHWISLQRAFFDCSQGLDLQLFFRQKVLCSELHVYETSSVETCFGLLYMQNGRYISSPLENNSVPRGQNIVEHSDSTRPTGMKILLPHKAVILRLMGDFATRKSSNEHEFSVVVTSLKKIGEGGIWDYTGNVFFLVTFKCIKLVAIASLNKIGEERIRDHTDPPRPL